MLIEVFLILVFILINGFFASSEIAVVTIRKTRLQALKAEGKASASILMLLKEEPERFLATVQIGATVSGGLASAISGALAVERLQPVISSIPIRFISMSANPISIGIVVIVVSYMSIIFGEIMPKTVALMHPEKIALFIARPIDKFANIVSMIITILTKSTNFLLSPFGHKAFYKRGYISEEELRLLLEEGRKDGVFEPEEQELIHSIFEFTDLTVQEVMIPIASVDVFSIGMPFDDAVESISRGQHSRYPVYSKDLNNIKGILYAKDVFATLVRNSKPPLSKLIRAALFVPETLKISRLLKQMQKRRIHMAVVVDEYGTVSGIATIEDILEEIVGEIHDEYDNEEIVVKVDKGIYIVDASISIRDLKEEYEIEIPDSPQYDSLGGYVITELQRIPQAGDITDLDGYRLTILEMENNRISKIKIELKGLDNHLNGEDK